MDNVLHLLGIARKAGRVEVGEEPVGASARARAAIMQMDFQKPSGSARSSVLSGTIEGQKYAQVYIGPERPRQKLSW